VGGEWKSGNVAAEKLGKYTQRKLSNPRKMTKTVKLLVRKEKLGITIEKTFFVSPWEFSESV